MDKLVIRKITEHETNEANRKVVVEAVDALGQGNASQKYRVSLLDGNLLCHTFAHIEFQNGPIQEVGVNGITHEVLLAIILDRLRAFQTSEYKCRENAIAITKLEEALMWLHKRTQGREARGVEGTHNP